MHAITVDLYSERTFYSGEVAISLLKMREEFNSYTWIRWRNSTNKYLLAHHKVIISMPFVTKVVCIINTVIYFQAVSKQKIRFYLIHFRVRLK
jgi:hypothetical protein